MANVHLCDGAAIDGVRLHVERLARETLGDAARWMAASLEQDRRDWREAGGTIDSRAAKA